MRDMKAYYQANKERIKAKVREYAANNKEKVAAKKARYYQENRDRLRAYTKRWRENSIAERRAVDRLRAETPRRKYLKLLQQEHERGLAVTITFEQFVELTSKSCDYCGGALPLYGVGLDRKDNSGGYSFDNVVPCCWPCNRLKLDKYTYGETKAMVAALVEYRRGKVG